MTVALFFLLEVNGKELFDHGDVGGDVVVGRGGDEFALACEGHWEEELVGEVASDGSLRSEEGFHAAAEALAEFFGAEVSFRATRDHFASAFEFGFSQANQSLAGAFVSFVDVGVLAGPFLLGGGKDSFSDGGGHRARDDGEGLFEEGSAFKTLDFAETGFQGGDTAFECSAS